MRSFRLTLCAGAPSLRTFESVRILCTQVHAQCAPSLRMFESVRFLCTQVLDSRFPLSATLFAYSTYSVGDMKASAVPAIAFSFRVRLHGNEYSFRVSVDGAATFVF